VASSQLQQLIELSVPFGIICADSPLGSSTYIVVLASDVRRYPGLTGFAQPLAGVRLKDLTSAEVNTFNRLKDQNRFTRVSLGQHGAAYELADAPFLAYYKSRYQTSQIQPSIEIHINAYK
jgi:hypothetical protein